VEHFRYELHTGSEVEVIDLWLDGRRGRIEVVYAAMGVSGRGYWSRVGPPMLGRHRLPYPSVGVQ
jgi:hypothetical protein